MPSESGHWYSKDGSPKYTIIGANKKERNTTLRDARKHGYVPSVTTIMNVADKPALTRWKVEQALMSALTLPQIEGESLDDFKKRAAVDSQQQAKQAAEEGTRIHGAVESFYQQGDIAGWLLENHTEAPYAKHVQATVEAINEAFPGETWLPEKSFCSELGYGGKVDLHSANVIVDFKTKEFGASDKVVAYDEQIMQLDAYRHGLGIPNATMANLYISRNNPGEVRLIIHDEGNHFDRFYHLLSYWKLVKGYDPMEES